MTGSTKARLARLEAAALAQLAQHDEAVNLARNLALSALTDEELETLALEVEASLPRPMVERVRAMSDAELERLVREGMR